MLFCGIGKRVVNNVPLETADYYCEYCRTLYIVEFSDIQVIASEETKKAVAENK